MIKGRQRTKRTAPPALALIIPLITVITIIYIITIFTIIAIVITIITIITSITSITRSATVCDGEQQNLATAFLDGSQIYGGVRRSQSSCKDIMIGR